MNKNDSFVAYEYKSITVKRESASVYTDCLSNFGWELVGQTRGTVPGVPIANAILGLTTSFASQIAPESKADGLDMVTLQYKRDRNIGSKQEIKKLEHQCEEALTAIDSLGKKNNALTMGTSLGVGIVGTAFIGLGVYNFICANVVLGVLFTAIGVVGWGIGFLTNVKGGKKRAAQSETKIQEQLDIAYSACEQAHALIA